MTDCKYWESTDVYMLFYYLLDDSYDSDEEDDKPQYVRLVYNAYSVVQFLKPDDTDSVNSDSATPSQGSSMSGKCNNALFVRNCKL